MPIPQLQKGQSWKDQNSSKKNKKKKRINKRKKFSLKNLIFNKKTFVLVLFLFVLGLFSGFGLVAWLSRDLPQPNQLIDRNIAESTKIYDRSGENILYEIHGKEQRTLMSLEEIPNHVKWATIAMEDKNFYKHQGFSLWAIFRTALTNVIYNKKSGGSTLTQQLIKNAVLTPEKTYTRKIKEIILAYKLEESFSKDEILQMYLNEIPYGGVTYGIEAASQYYFNKSAKEINIAEAAVLASLPQAPSKYSPYGPNKELLIKRQHYIIDLMLEQGYITKEQAQNAKNFDLKFAGPSGDITAPHFVMYVKEQLADKYGQQLVERGGLKVYTTLDLYKQKIAKEVVEEGVAKNKQNYQANNAGLIAIDPKTGQILSMVGSRDYFDKEIDGQFNITTAKRQPGSSIKPLVYATAFEKGYTPDTILYDVVTDFSNNKNKSYKPRNYDLKEHGPVSMKKALAGSLNIPAVKTLYLSGVDEVLKNARETGYSTLKNKDRFGLSLVLGGAEVKLVEHTNAFSAFAREGEINPVSSILKIEDKNGKIIEEFKEKKRNVIDPKTARMINDILSDNQARSYAFGSDNYLNLGSRPVAAKTGTTNDYKDAWTIGYTPSLVTGTWVGNNNNSAMRRGASGGTVAAPIWYNFMKRILGDTPVEQFNKPKKIKTDKPILDGKIAKEKTIKIDRASGLLATEHTPEDYIKKIKTKEHHCILYYLNKDDPRGEIPEDPSQDPQFELWEKPVQEWAKKEMASSSTSTMASTTIPTEEDNVHKPENEPVFEILKPNNNAVISSPNLSVDIQATAPRGINRAEYYINNNLISIVSAYPFNLEKNISFLSNGYHNLRIKVCDDVDNCSEKSMEFNLNLENREEYESIDISWLEPQNGLAVNNIDFPLNLKTTSNPPEQINKMEFYYSPKNSDEENLVKTIDSINDPTTQFTWEEVPASGTYEIYIKGYSWSGETKQTKKININVTSSN